MGFQEAKTSRCQEEHLAASGHGPRAVLGGPAALTPVFSSSFSHPCHDLAILFSHCEIPTYFKHTPCFFSPHNSGDSSMILFQKGADIPHSTTHHKKSGSVGVNTPFWRERIIEICAVLKLKSSY